MTRDSSQPQGLGPDWQPVEQVKGQLLTGQLKTAQHRANRAVLTQHRANRAVLTQHRASRAV